VREKYPLQGENIMSIPTFNPSPSACKAFGDMFGNPFQSAGGLYPSNRNYGQFSTGGNLHDTFKIDRYNNIYGGHTSVYLKGVGKISMPWG